MPKLKIQKWDGKPVTRAGIYSDVPLDVYHSQEICDGPSVSSSGLRRVLERNGGSPAHFWNEWSGNPDCEESEEKQQFVFGRAAHHLLLSESFFQAHFAIREEVDAAWTSWRTVASQEWRAALVASGRSALTAEDIVNIRGMSRAIHENELVNPKYRTKDGWRHYSMLNGYIEQSFFWKDKVTGLWCKARPDAIPTDSGDYADLKTTTSVAYIPLMRTISDFAYHQQAALIAEGSKQCAGIEMSSYTLVFVEKKRPWCVRPVPLNVEDIALGERQNRYALDLVARCIKQKRWPGPGEDHITSIRLTETYRKAAKGDIELTEEDAA